MRAFVDRLREEAARLGSTGLGRLRRGAQDAGPSFEVARKAAAEAARRVSDAASQARPQIAPARAEPEPQRAPLSFDAGFVLDWYMRLMALVFLVMGVFQWAVLIGVLSWDGRLITAAPLPVQAATVYFAVVDLTAAIGLWLAAPWGGVIWLLATMSRIMLHSAFMSIFGQDNVSVALMVVSILAYLILTFLADRQERAKR